ncbi:protein kinase [uncultured Amnibacterium sp.]|uniref:protein kinase domain-containing protein n=1 Tax=uncultured Amnibacterium sp. TaxID=1631851 RepID=UPI0035CA800D
MTDAAATTARPEPRTLGGRYRLGPVLGRGAMSVVHRAHDLLIGREVAVKLFTAPADTPEELRKQQAEAALIGSLNHHALTTLLDAGADTTDPRSPRLYLVMEYVRGLDLRERLAQGVLTPQQVCWLGFDLGEGLQHLHAAGFLHRDVKPANVLLAEQDEAVRLRGKLTDFGIAARIHGDADDEFTTGTAAYLSPEQVEGEDAEPASDVYALGLVLLEALTGRTAFPGSVQVSAFARLERQPEISSSIPLGVADLLSRMTAREPSRRPSAGGVAAAFQALLVQDLVANRVVDALPVDARAESARLAAVRRYNILDTPPEDAFDDITRIATRMLHAPVALVSIIDADRVWHKSRQGTDVAEVDRNTSFCSTTVPDHDGPWSIPDAREDDRTRANALVTDDPNVRAYASAPLITHDGHRLGSLCVFDFQPHEFSSDDLADLTSLAAIVMRELELRLASRRALFDL